jgi:ribosomal protein RSM22 (predicted rRNA methylase)
VPCRFCPLIFQKKDHLWHHRWFTTNQGQLMSLPEELQAAIEAETKGFSMSALASAREALTHRYRSCRGQQIDHLPLISNEAERLAYLGARLPATFAAVGAVLAELQRQVDPEDIASVLDLGAGPGTASWAVSRQFPQIESYTLLEQDAELINLGKRLASYDAQLATKMHWQQGAMPELCGIATHDMLLLSYAASELPTEALEACIARCWSLTKRFLLIIEPGTPAGFAVIRRIRSQLIDCGAHLVAPCPHAATCPMAGENWCHFSQRIERSFLHRHLKQASLGFEDEKFSYLIAAVSASNKAYERILRRPQKHSGHVTLELCTPAGLRQQIVSKRTPEAYRLARKVEWGDSWSN